MAEGEGEGAGEFDEDVEGEGADSGLEAGGVDEAGAAGSGPEGEGRLDGFGGIGDGDGAEEVEGGAEAAGLAVEGGDFKGVDEAGAVDVEIAGGRDAGAVERLAGGGAGGREVEEFAGLPGGLSFAIDEGDVVGCAFAVKAGVEGGAVADGAGVEGDGGGAVGEFEVEGFGLGVGGVELAVVEEDLPGAGAEQGHPAGGEREALGFGERDGRRRRGRGIEEGVPGALSGDGAEAGGGGEEAVGGGEEGQVGGLLGAGGVGGVGEASIGEADEDGGKEHVVDDMHFVLEVGGAAGEGGGGEQGEEGADDVAVVAHGLFKPEVLGGDAVGDLGADAEGAVEGVTPEVVVAGEEGDLGDGGAVPAGDVVDAADGFVEQRGGGAEEEAGPVLFALGGGEGVEEAGGVDEADDGGGVVEGLVHQTGPVFSGLEGPFRVVLGVEIELGGGPIGVAGFAGEAVEAGGFEDHVDVAGAKAEDPAAVEFGGELDLGIGGAG